MAEYREVYTIEARDDASGVLGKAERAYDDLNESIKKTYDSVEKNNRAMAGSGMASVFDALLGRSSNIGDSLNRSEQSMEGMSSWGGKLADEMNRAMESVADLGNRYANLSHSDLLKEQSRLEKNVDRYAEKVNKAAAAHTLFTQKQLENLDARYEVTTGKVQELQDAIQSLQSTTKGSSDVTGYFRAINIELKDTIRLQAQNQKYMDDLAKRQEQAQKKADKGGFDNSAKSELEGLNANYAEALKYNKELAAKANELAENLGKAPDWVQEQLRLEDTLNNELLKQLEIREGINREKQQVLNRGPADTQRNYSKLVTDLATEQAKLDAVNEQLERTSDLGAKIGAEFKDAGKAAASAFGNVFKKNLKGISNLVDKIKKSFKDWHKEQKSIGDQAKAFYNTFYSLWRMFKTRLKRRLVGVAFEDFTTYLGKMAQISPRFNSAMSNFVVSIKTLGAQITAILEPLAARLLPYLSQLVDLLTTAASNVTQFVSQLTGYDTFVKATKGQYDFATAMDKTSTNTKKANKAAKEYKNTVLSFDQLHKLNGDDDDSALDDLGLDAVDMEMAELESNKFMDIAQRIWDALNIGDFKEAGKALGDGVTEAFAWLKDVAGWTKNGDKITGYLNNFKDFVNGFIDGWDPHIIGDAIGDVLNTLVESWLQLTDPRGIHWREMGKELGTTFATILKTVKWKDLGIGIIQGIQDAVQVANGFISSGLYDAETKEFKSVFALLGDALSELFAGMVDTISVDNWSDLFSGLINGFFEFLEHAFQDPAKAAELGRKVADILNQTLKKMDEKQIASGINAFTGSLNEFVSEALTGFDFGTLFYKFGGILVHLNWGNLFKTIGLFCVPSLFSGLATGIASLLGSGGLGLLGLAGKGIGGLLGLGGKGLKSLASLFGFGSETSVYADMAAKGLAAESAATAAEGAATAAEGAATAAEAAAASAAGSSSVMSTLIASLPYVAAGAAAAAGAVVADKYVLPYLSEKLVKPLVGDAVDVVYGKNNDNPSYVIGRHGTSDASSVLPSVSSFLPSMFQDYMPEWMKSRTADALSEQDSTTFMGNLMTSVKEATALPTSALATQDMSTFMEDIEVSTYNGVSRALAENTSDQTITVNTYLDGDVIQRSTNKRNAADDKRTNPFSRMALGAVYG